MALGDGIRRNVATISQEERDLLRDAIVELNQDPQRYPGGRDDIPLAGGVTFWFKQDEIHQATHVHHGPAFLPWHRELCNRFEALLRGVDSRLSLHYWDWTTDPHDLFTPDFMGAANGDAGEPWLSAGLYNPTATPFRSDNPFDPTNNPFDPPRTLTRDLPAGPPPSGTAPGWPSDAQILNAATFPEMRTLLEGAHDHTHGYIGGAIGGLHTAFRDPFVFLLHSNVDRLFAMWQQAPGQAWRLDPNQVYGTEGTTGGHDGILAPLDPWAGNPLNDPLIDRARPWAPPENEQVVKDSKHHTVVAPPPYDTVPEVPPESVIFVHVVTGQNISNTFPCTTYVDHPLTNANPNAILFVTHNWNPLGMPTDQGQFNNHPIGVWYNEGLQQWAIYNEDEADMVEGVAFNVSAYAQPSSP